MDNICNHYLSRLDSHNKKTGLIFLSPVRVNVNDMLVEQSIGFSITDLPPDTPVAILDSCPAVAVTFYLGLPLCPMVITTFPFLRPVSTYL